MRRTSHHLEVVETWTERTHTSVRKGLDLNRLQYLLITGVRACHRSEHLPDLTSVQIHVWTARKASFWPFSWPGRVRAQGHLVVWGESSMWACHIVAIRPILLTSVHPPIFHCIYSYRHVGMCLSIQPFFTEYFCSVQDAIDATSGFAWNLWILVWMQGWPLASLRTPLYGV